MDYCFYCGTKINQENSTKEHIFLAGLNDRLVSERIICRKCNNELGEKIDESLSRDMNPYVKIGGGNVRSSVGIPVFDSDVDDLKYRWNPNKGEIHLDHRKLETVQYFRNSQNELTNVRATGYFKNFADYENTMRAVAKKNKINFKSDVIQNNLKKVKQNQNLYQRKVPLGNLDVCTRLSYKDWSFAVLKMGIEFALLCGFPRKYFWKSIKTLHLSAESSEEVRLGIADELYKLVHPVEDLKVDLKVFRKKTTAKLWVENQQLCFAVVVFGMFKYFFPLTGIIGGLDANVTFEYDGDPENFKRVYGNKLKY